MPDPNKKISTPSKESPCEIKSACGSTDSAKTGSAEAKKKSTGSKPITIGEDKSQKTGKGCESAAVVQQATLNKEPCSTGSDKGTCHLARPDRSFDPKSRIDKKKAGCINFESCEGDEVASEASSQGCMNYEDCKEYTKEEKMWKKKMKEMEKNKKKEGSVKSTAGTDRCSSGR